ncbi:MAG: cation:proton antiporter [Bacteroidetes bacterium]|nr:cation:proton antiporter [Bacteroidota bacterium]HET6244487.1 cation:proton antiporter [Bacteroidia bacterium]
MNLLLIENLSVIVFLPIMGIAIMLVVIRFIKGPSLTDRVVALDLLVTIGIAIISVYSIATGQSAYLDIAMILALIAFLSTIAFAYYLKRRGTE